MKVTYNWLKDFVEISLRPQELADKLTMAGLEVKEIERFEDDYVFEIEITSNRPDWLSVIGVAREVAAITGKKLKAAKSPVTKNEGRMTKGEGRCAVIIADKDACPFYSARIIRNVKVGPSPVWMIKRLQAIGLRSINNIVDSTNYVLFTTGQPLHAFDLDTIGIQKTEDRRQKTEIIVRRAKNAEEITTIDGIKRKLTSGILVIADEKKPIAIAGIMGGKDTEVSQATQNILLESAYFSPIVIRKASRFLGLASDSSYRFERSVDKSTIAASSNLAASLIVEYANGECGKLYKAGLEKCPKKSIRLNLLSVYKLLGQTIPFTKIKSILKSLECKIIAQKKGLFQIEIPAFRQDIKQEIDLVEEFSRIAGYETIPLTLPSIKPLEIRQDPILLVQNKIRGLAAALGLSEVITYSLLSQENIKKIGGDLENTSRLENPLSLQQEVLRPALLPGLLEALRLNAESGNKICGFFEIGQCFSQASEYKAFAIIAENCALLELKGKLQAIFTALGISDYIFSNTSRPFFQEGAAALITIVGQDLGVIGIIQEGILEKYKIESPKTGFLEINLDIVKRFVNLQRMYTALPKYPSVSRDISLAVDEAISYQEIIDALMALDAPWLLNISFKDIYRSEAIGKGKKSITLSLEFRSPEKTLTDTEVNACVDGLTQRIALKFNAQIR